MDLGTIVAAASSSLGLSLAGAYWLARTLIQSRLSEALEQRKSELSRQLETHKLGLSQDLERTKGQIQLELGRDKAVFDAAIKREVEAQLGQMAAQRQYEYEARRRLYTAIGPLRFQLLLACRDLAGRIESFHTREHYRMDIASYYGRSTLYRLLRPLAIAELIERQIGVADFAVDPSAVVCLRFRRTITRIFSGDELVRGRPDVDWGRQAQHVFADSLAACAQALIQRDGSAERILRFDEFNARLDADGMAAVSPFDQLLDGLQVGAKPILWLRLVAYGHACNALIDRLGPGLDFESRPFPTAALLAATGDAHTAGHLAELQERVREVELVAL
ncbi:MAG TPA: hypothetical protein VGE36_16225 [Roseateles sp.]